MLERFREKVFQKAGTLLKPKDTKLQEDSADSEPVISLIQLVNITPNSLRNIADALERDTSYQSIQSRLSSPISLRATDWNKLLEKRARIVRTILTTPNDS